MVITRGKGAIDCQILRKNKNLYLSQKGIMQYARSIKMRVIHMFILSLNPHHVVL